MSHRTRDLLRLTVGGESSQREYAAKDDRIVAYLQIVLTLKSKFPRCDFKQVSRSENNHTDSLANLGSAVEYQFRQEIPIEYIMKPSIQRSGEVLCLDTYPGWRDPTIAYLKDGVLPSDKTEAQKLQQMAAWYMLLRDVLYIKSYSKLHSDPYLRFSDRKKPRR